MIFALAACGKSSASPSPSGSKPKDAEATPAPEFVYKSEFKNLVSGTRTYFSTGCFTDNGVYAFGNEVVGSNKPEDAVEEYLGQYDIFEPRIFFIGFDGKLTKLSGYTPVEKPEAEEGQFDYQSESYLQNVNMTSSGDLVAVEALYSNWVDDGELDMNNPDYWDHYVFSQAYYIRHLDSTGAEISSTVIDVPREESLSCYPVLDGNDNLVAVRYKEDGSCEIVGISSDGEVSYTIPAGDYVENILGTDDGTVYAAIWGNSGSELHPIDFDAEKLGSAIPLPGDSYQTYTGGGDYPIYYTNGTNLYGFNPEDGEPVKLFNWLDLDVNTDYINGISIDGDGVLRTVSTTYNNLDMNYDVDLLTVSKVPYDPSAQKQELTLAVQYLDWDMRNAIIAYNRSSDTTRIKVIDYSEFNTEDDYSAGTNKMTTEIISGNIPDMIYLQGMPVGQFANKGILEDLYPYLQNDPEIKLSDLYENVLEAAEINGKLYSAFPYFTFNTCIGASSLVGDDAGWTYDDMNSALAELPEGASAFEAYTTRDEILYTCLGLDMKDFVDWSTGRVDFDNEEFYSLLEFAKGFPTEFNWDEYDYSMDSPEVRISEGRQLLYRTSVSGASELEYIESCFRGAPVTFVGFPTLNGTGNTVTISSNYAMTSACSDKEAAWQFLRQMFTGEYYSNYCYYYGLPIVKSIMEKQMKDATTVQYKVDENGQYVLDDNGERIPQERYFATDNNEAYTYYALNQEIADAFMDAVNSCNKSSDYDQSIIDIVTEQAGAFFSGQKSAQEVAKLVQSKANIYVNEQR